VIRAADKSYSKTGTIISCSWPKDAWPLPSEVQSSIEIDPTWVPESRLRQSLKELSFYADVPSAIDCRRPKNTAHKLICGSTYLQLAELLNTRADAYAIENATKIEVNHKRFRGKTPGACTSEQCIYEFFKAQTNVSLGGESPYYER
jgi:hypothetical protein